MNKMIFRFMSYPYRNRGYRTLGPASVKYYDHNLTLTEQTMRCEPGLRLKLSEAVSHLYFLRPHSIILSQIEGQPLSAYHNPSAYSLASLLYLGGSTPGRDLHNCLISVRGKSSRPVFCTYLFSILKRIMT
jgi:hypothetical protein